MFDEVIVYSPIHHLRPEFIMKMGLIYDRVILPLPDAIRSKKIDWLTDLSQHCPYTSQYVNNIENSFGGDCEFCRALTIDEYNSLAMTSDIFRDEFFVYIEKNIGNDEWSKLVSQAIDCAQDVLNFFITQDIIEARGHGNIVFPLQSNNRNEKMIDRIANILKVEAHKCAMQGFELPNDRTEFEKLLATSKSMESKFNLMKELQDASIRIAYLWNEQEDKEFRKHELRREALNIAAAYNNFIVDLEKYCGTGAIKLKRGASNSLLLAADIVKPRARVQELKMGWAGIKWGLDEYANHYGALWQQSKSIDEALSVNCRWQNDLLTFRCDMDKEFGKKESYRKLSRSSFWQYLKEKLFG